ncbi:MAG: translation elongation factor Ts [Firmicutes bacterium]|jgi:elongation factor Ts|nr:translation elongation factor Ts [Bacillota bacterium]
MADVTAKDVQALRQATGAGILDARKALVECDGDFNKASDWLREKGLAGAAKREDRERSEGAVAVYVTSDGKLASLCSIECETDFVAKSEDFMNLVAKIAEEVAKNGEEVAETFVSDIDNLKVVLKENIALGKVVRFETQGDSILGHYIHTQNGRGVNGVLVEIAGGTEELAHDVAVHIAFGKPKYLNREDVPADLVAKERETVEKISKNEGKPEAALPKIVEGRLNTWYKDLVLTEQSYVKDDKKQISEILQGAKIVRFAQILVGAE